MSLRRLYGPKEILLFPENCLIINHYETKLSNIVNSLLRTNPLAISRIFENKKEINPDGIYCIWLRNPKGIYQPVYINDEFAFNRSWNSVYAPINQDNSIWFMLLEKAIAKLLGGYHHLAEATISTILNCILGCPIVDFGLLTPSKLLKIFDDKIFYNKMATLYIYRSEPDY